VGGEPVEGPASVSVVGVMVMVRDPWLSGRVGCAVALALMIDGWCEVD
jgi:hypothetical protein